MRWRVWVGSYSKAGAIIGRLCKYREMLWSKSWVVATCPLNGTGDESRGHREHDGGAQQYLAKWRPEHAQANRRQQLARPKQWCCEDQFEHNSGGEGRWRSDRTLSSQRLCVRQ